VKGKETRLNFTVSECESKEDGKKVEEDAARRVKKVWLAKERRRVFIFK
jgi:hypothetical protein